MHNVEKMWKNIPQCGKLEKWWKNSVAMLVFNKLSTMKFGLFIAIFDFSTSFNICGKLVLWNVENHVENRFCKVFMKEFSTLFTTVKDTNICILKRNVHKDSQ